MRVPPLQQPQAESISRTEEQKEIPETSEGFQTKQRKNDRLRLPKSSIHKPTLILQTDHILENTTSEYYEKK
jgi:hypothetical protein